MSKNEKKVYRNFTVSPLILHIQIYHCTMIQESVVGGQVDFCFYWLEKITGNK
jgi:hypothetical protein